MTYSYLSSEPGSSERSWVRLKLADNTSGNVELQDEEIELLLAAEGSKERAAIAGARAIGARYARKADKKVGRLSISHATVAKHYFDLAAELERNMRNRPGGASGLYAGGIEASDKETEEADTDRVAPAFSRGQFDNDGLGADSTGDWL